MLGWFKTTKLHFIGIGGIGMSGIAEVLLDLGYNVSGSDLSSSSVTDNLAKKGCEIHIGHHEKNIEGATLLIYSSAIDPKNPEVVRARELGLPLIRRAEMLAELMRLKFGIAVAGSHGKTTTTSLIATIFHEAHQDATHIVGGIVSNLGGNARKGDGQYLIAEADESDGSFLLLSPIMAAITNIDNDHLDHYGTDDKIIDAFVEFVNRLPFYGRVALNADDKNSLGIKARVKRSIMWYGKGNGALDELDYKAENIKFSASGTKFNLVFKGKAACEVETNLLGDHNVSNTLAAISIAHEAGLSWDQIKKGCLSFKGVGRRLEKLLERDQFVVIDDYGHHPTEIKATISALKSIDSRPLTVIFEPHRFSRTQNFWTEFQESFTGADEVFISPIYPASESPILGITSDKLVSEMKKSGLNTNYVSDLSEMKSILIERSSSSRIFLTLGAGSISKRIRAVIKEL
jgi:UDP-N-acetylmuramate--alanine ligase